MDTDFKEYLLQITGASDCFEKEVIQTLWSDYGKISRYQLIDSKLNTIVIKYIALNQSKGHPRGWNTDISHNRKVHSYKVETEWYKNWSQRCSSDCKIPKFIGSYSKEDDKWIIMEDLNIDFPLRKYQINLDEVKTCLKWLAHFHSRFINMSPDGLWKVGTYWHLETRPDEFEMIEHIELKSKAHKIDDILNNCSYQTIVHGDAKLANFCFSENGREVAAVDFQYVGGGCGMKDVAYFLGSCLSCDECEFYEDELLNFYFDNLNRAIQCSDLKINVKQLHQEWREMYPFACADFTRFMLGWMPNHQKINQYNLKKMNEVLSSL